MKKDEAARKKQEKTFIETARKLGCDEDEAAFDRKLGKIAKAKPTIKKAK